MPAKSARSASKRAKFRFIADRKFTIMSRKRFITEHNVKDINDKHLEGGNPSRSKHDRVALLHCRRARELGVERIVAGSVGHYGAALARASCAFGLKCAIYIPRKDGDRALDALRKEIEKCGARSKYAYPVEMKKKKSK